MLVALLLVIVGRVVMNPHPWLLLVARVIGFPGSENMGCEEAVAGVLMKNICLYIM